MVSTLGTGSRSTPPSAMPPSSWTWKVRLVYGETLALSAGANRSRPPAIKDAGTNCPGKTGKPKIVSVPAAGGVVIRTPAKLFGGRSEERRVGKAATLNG